MLVLGSFSADLVTRQAGYPADLTQIRRAPIHSVEILTPKNKGTIRKKIRFGPYAVPGSKVTNVGKLSDAQDRLGTLAFVNRIESLCGSDCLILWGVGIPEFENGTAITAVGASVYNHHVFALYRDKLAPAHICPGDPNSSGKNPVAIINSQTDQESSIYTSADGKVKSGHFVKSTDKIDLFAEFMNYRTESARITVALDFEYIPGKPEGYLNAQSIMFSATPCNQIGFNVPTKQYSITSNKWTAPVDLTLMNARGHQHNGGVGMKVFVNDKEVCSSVPTYVKIPNRSNGTEVQYGIKEMSLCELHVQLKRGDALIIKSDYDIEKYPQREGNAGQMEMVAAMLSAVLGLPPDFDLANL